MQEDAATETPSDPSPTASLLTSSTDRSRTLSSAPSFPSSSGPSVAGFEVQIVQEYCDLGSLSFFMQRQQRLMQSQHPGLGDAAAVAVENGWGLSYAAILETASDVANGMRQLHTLNIVHSDCKVCTIRDWGAALSIRPIFNPTGTERRFVLVGPHCLWCMYCAGTERFIEEQWQ